MGREWSLEGCGRRRPSRSDCGEIRSPPSRVGAPNSRASRRSTRHFTSEADVTVFVRLRQPSRVIEVRGGRTARAVLMDLELVAEAHLVICNGALVPADTYLAETDEIEIRPVISGG